jgi:predicted XRE-type DNA-binding protein
VRDEREVSDTDDLRITRGSGNVFADIGYPNPEEALIKADLIRLISGEISARGSTQAQAAAVLGVDQPRVSDLIRGRLDLFSIERLLRFLLALDRDVEIHVRPKSGGSSAGTLKVVA